jgi:MtN3 and saliva related transmembrane protein
METQALANTIGYIAALIGSLMFMPQAYQVWKTKNTSGISLISYFLLGSVSVLWFVYGYLMHATPVMIVNFIIAVLSLYIVLAKLRYK